MVQDTSRGKARAAAWLCGNGCVPLYNLMEDAATAEISRTQIWQWIRHGASLKDGRQVTVPLFRQVLRDETNAMRAELGVPVHFAPLDLGDLLTVPRTLECVQRLLAGRRLSIVVANAGLWPTRHACSAQGHELAFATNVLGHHALLRGALELGLLADGARVVVVTGDIYVMSSHCSSDYSYRGPLGGQRAYCRSKLGNLWHARELARRHPELRVHAVHPGVIGSELGGGNAAIVGAIKRASMLSLEQGAQTSLFCATQPDLESGTYYHNVLGRVVLHPDDPAADDVKSAAFWDLVEELCSAGGSSLAEAASAGSQGP